jgi:hypothetical protein
MESLGGVGYLLNEESQHINVARLFRRDACVGAIWEGTTDVLAGDSVRALKHARVGEEVVTGVRWLVGSGEWAGGCGGGRKRGRWGMERNVG